MLLLRASTGARVATAHQHLRRTAHPLQARSYAAAGFAGPAPLDASKLAITRATVRKPHLPNDKLVFGHSFTDHMLEVQWDRAGGWGAPQIVPYHNLSLDPACSVFHYGLELFEGMKAYKDSSGRIRMFRPEENMRRMNDSATRLALPSFDSEQMLQLIRELLRLDQSWIPSERGYSLYIRPTIIATAPFLGVSPSSSALMYVILSPVGPYYPEGFKPVKLLASSKYVRAFPGGTGGSKLGANYAPTILPQVEAAKKGYTQILWTLDGNMGEVGTMNLFVHWINEQGHLELATPPLDGTILPGVTRASVLELTRYWNEFAVAERNISLERFALAVREKRVLEVFGVGTAAVVSPVQLIHWEAKGEDLVLPIDRELQAGPLAARLWTTLTDIQYGAKSFCNWSVVVPAAE